MIDIVCEILGLEFGTTCYDDMIVAGALFIGITVLLLFISICKSIYHLFL